jgi:hypothetical protein
MEAGDMGFDLLGTVILFFALILVAALQVGAALGVMYGMHKLYPDKLTETTYGSFDFDNFQRPAFQELLVKLAMVYLPPTMLFHMLDYFLVGTYINRYLILVSLVLFILESAAIGVVMFILFQLDRFRLTVLTVSSAIFYLFCLWYLAGKHLLA